MLLSYSLANNIQCDKLCKDIANAVTKISKEGHDGSTLQLVIDIRKVVESDQSLLPKLECKNS